MPEPRAATEEEVQGYLRRGRAPAPASDAPATEEEVRGYLPPRGRTLPVTEIEGSPPPSFLGYRPPTAPAEIRRRAEGRGVPERSLWERIGDVALPTTERPVYGEDLRGEAGARGATEGLTFGFSDELAARARAGLDNEATYESILAEESARTARAREQSPGAFAVGELAGMAPLMAVPGLGAASKARLAALGGGRGLQLAGQIIGTAAEGAGIGALYGAGTAEPGQRTEGARSGVRWGGGTAGVLGAGGTALTGAARWLAPRAQPAAEALLRRANLSKLARMMGRRATTEEVGEIAGVVGGRSDRVEAAVADLEAMGVRNAEDAAAQQARSGEELGNVAREIDEQIQIPAQAPSPAEAAAAEAQAAAAARRAGVDVDAPTVAASEEAAATTVSPPPTFDSATRPGRRRQAAPPVAAAEETAAVARPPHEQAFEETAAYVAGKQGMAALALGHMPSRVASRLDDLAADASRRGDDEAARAIGIETAKWRRGMGSFDQAWQNLQRLNNDVQWNPARGVLAPAQQFRADMVRAVRDELDGVAAAAGPEFHQRWRAAARTYHLTTPIVRAAGRGELREAATGQRGIAGILGGGVGRRAGMVLGGAALGGYQSGGDLSTRLAAVAAGGVGGWLANRVGARLAPRALETRAAARLRVPAALLRTGRGLENRALLRNLARMQTELAADDPGHFTRMQTDPDYRRLMNEEQEAGYDSAY